MNLILKIRFMKFFYLLFFFSSIQCFTQLNCKIIKTLESSIETCFHQNGKNSTIQIWDLNRRNGSIEGFNNKGESIFKFYLRTYAGHASAHWEYYSNGQVKKINYSSAPDGGIQHYSGSRTYDENGNQTNSYDDEYPPRLITRLEKEEIKLNTKSEPPSIINAFTTYYQISNQTRKKQIILYKLKNQNFIHRKIIKPNQIIYLDSLKGNKLLSYDQIDIIQFQDKNLNFQILKPQEVELSSSLKTWIWYIITKK